MSTTPKQDQAKPPPPPSELIPSDIKVDVDTFIDFNDGYQPIGIAISPDGKLVAVSVEGKNEYFVNLYDPRTKSLVQSIGKLRGHKDGSFAEAQFDYAMGLDFTQDSKALYVADYGNDCIRCVRFDSMTVHTVSGGAEGYYDGNLKDSRYHCPTDIKVDPLSDPRAPLLFVTEYYNHSLRQLDLVSDTVTSLIGGQVLRKSIHGQSADAGPPPFKLINPTGVSVREDGAIFIVDYGNDRIVKYDRVTKTPKVVAGVTKSSGARDGLATCALFRFPTCMCFVPKTNDVILCDYAQHNIRFIEAIEDDFPVCTSLVNAAKIRGKDDGDSLVAKLTFPRHPAILPAKFDHSTEGYTIFVTEYRGAVRRIHISAAEAFRYHQRRTNSSNPTSLSSLLSEENFSDVTILCTDGVKRKAHASIIRARCPILFRTLRDSPDKLGLDSPSLDLLLDYIYGDNLPLAKVSDDFESSAKRAAVSNMLNAIRVGTMFSVPIMVSKARALLGSLILQSALNPKLQETIFDILQDSSKQLGMADEVENLRELSRKGNFSETATKYSALPESSMRKDLSRMLDSTGILKMADVSVVFSSPGSSTGLTEMRVHSAVLYSRSAYFRSLLGGRFGTDDQLTLEAGPMADQVSSLDQQRFMENLVGVFYARDTYTPNSLSEALLLLDRLHFYGVDDDAQHRAHQVILSQLNNQNCLQILKLVVDVPGLESVRRAALWTVCSNLKSFYAELEHEKDQRLLNKILLFKATFL